MKKRAPPFPFSNLQLEIISIKISHEDYWFWLVILGIIIYWKWLRCLLRIISSSRCEIGLRTDSATVVESTSSWSSIFLVLDGTLDGTLDETLDGTLDGTLYGTLYETLEETLEEILDETLEGLKIIVLEILETNGVALGFKEEFMDKKVLVSK